MESITIEATQLVQGNFLRNACCVCLNEDDPYPVGHGVGAGPPEVPVDDDHGDEDAHRVHDEGEQQVLHHQSVR